MQTIKNTLYLYAFNNYFNREVKKLDNLSDYPAPVASLPATNWYSNDGVNTTHVINMPVPLADYLIVVGNNSEIESRWFIIDYKKNCRGQYELTLRRDLCVDFYDILIDSPCYI